MSAVLCIAKKEFKSGFSTPRTGAVIFFLLVMSGVFFALFLHQISNQGNPMMGGGSYVPPIQQVVRGLVENLQFMIILILPSLTMGAFSEEIKNNSIRFLQTAPISSFSVVLGKFFARFFTMFLALALCSVFSVFLAVFGNPEIPVILSSYLGLLLLVSFQLSFGILVSSLTSQQFMAFLFTMLGLFGFFILGFIAPMFPGAGLFSDVLQYLAPTTHMDNFLNGLITVGDVSYFLVMITGFLYLANVSYDSKRWR